MKTKINTPAMLKRVIMYLPNHELFITSSMSTANERHTTTTIVKKEYKALNVLYFVTCFFCKTSIKIIMISALITLIADFRKEFRRYFLKNQ